MTLDTAYIHSRMHLYSIIVAVVLQVCSGEDKQEVCTMCHNLLSQPSSPCLAPSKTWNSQTPYAVEVDTVTISLEDMDSKPTRHSLLCQKICLPNKNQEQATEKRVKSHEDINTDPYLVDGEEGYVIRRSRSISNRNDGHIFDQVKRILKDHRSKDAFFGQSIFQDDDEDFNQFSTEVPQTPYYSIPETQNLKETLSHFKENAPKPKQTHITKLNILKPTDTKKHFNPIIYEKEFTEEQNSSQDLKIEIFYPSCKGENCSKGFSGQGMQVLDKLMRSTEIGRRYLAAYTAKILQHLTTALTDCCAQQQKRGRARKNVKKILK